MKNKNLIKARDLFRECADIMDEMIVLDEKEENGEDVKREIENATGRLLIKMLELSVLSNKIKCLNQ